MNQNRTMTKEEQSKITGAAVLACPMNPTTNDAEASSIRDYLVKLILGVWENGEGFSGKRPFGNSGWTFELAAALVRGELLDGRFDEDGYLDEYAGDQLDYMMLLAINALGEVKA